MPPSRVHSEKRTSHTNRGSTQWWPRPPGVPRSKGEVARASGRSSSLMSSSVRSSKPEPTLDLEPVLRASREVHAVALLRDHALQMLFAGGGEEFGAVADDMIAVVDDSARRQEEPQTFLARLERDSAHIASVEPERVEEDRADRHLRARALDVGRAREPHSFL